MFVGGLSQSVNQSCSRPKGDFSIFRGAMAPLPSNLDPPLMALNQKQMSRPVSSYQQRRRARCAVRAAARSDACMHIATSAIW